MKITSKSAMGLANVFQFLASPVGMVVGAIALLLIFSEDFRIAFGDLLKSLVPLLDITTTLIIPIFTDVIKLLATIIGFIGKLLSYVIKVIEWCNYLGITVLGGIVYPFEAVIKVVQTVLKVLQRLFTFDFKGLGKELSNLWTNWGATDIVLGGASGLKNFTFTTHADGGYSNANLIMTHENGKREWVGKAAGSSAIVNDTQMSDIMEVAVAKGVFGALSAHSATSGEQSTNETIVIKIGEEAVFNAVRKAARRQGRDFAKA
jgi:hypothetical protein